MSAIEGMRQIIVGLYNLMNNCRLHVFGFPCTLWDIYLYGFLAVVGVFVFVKIVRS